MIPPSAKTAALVSLLLIAAVSPILLTALPGRAELREARESVAAAPVSDAEAMHAAEAERRRLEEDVVPFAREAAAFASPAAPLGDAAGDRVLRLMEAATTVGATFVSATAAEDTEIDQGGYVFHTVDLKAEGSFAAIHAYLTTLERGERLIVVRKATLRRVFLAERPNVQLEAKLVFVERREAPDPADVVRRNAETRRSER